MTSLCQNPEPSLKGLFGVVCGGGGGGDDYCVCVLFFWFESLTAGENCYSASLIIIPLLSGYGA